MIDSKTNKFAGDARRGTFMDNQATVSESLVNFADASIDIPTVITNNTEVVDIHCGEKASNLVE